MTEDNGSNDTPVDPPKPKFELPPEGQELFAEAATTKTSAAIADEALDTANDQVTAATATQVKQQELTIEAHRAASAAANKALDWVRSFFNM